jgi:two-component system, OmpR family, response regulator
MSRWNDKHVLVIEDDVDLCNTMVESLKREGILAVAAYDPRMAAFKLKNQTYHCILADLHLGEERGQVVIEAIRTRKDYQNMNTPIYVISGHLDKNVVMELRAKIQGALVKPFELSQMLDLVKNAVGKTGT